MEDNFVFYFRGANARSSLRSLRSSEHRVNQMLENNAFSHGRGNESDRPFDSLDRRGPVPSPSPSAKVTFTGEPFWSSSTQSRRNHPSGDLFDAPVFDAPESDAISVGHDSTRTNIEFSNSNRRDYEMGLARHGPECDSVAAQPNLPQLGPGIHPSGSPHLRPAGSHTRNHRTTVGDLNFPVGDGPVNDSPELTRKIAAAMRILNDAYSLAARCGGDVWQFAVEITEFAELNISRNVLRLLAWQGQVAHRNETTGPGEARRTYQNRDLVFSSRSCLALPESGRETARRKIQPELESDIMNRKPGNLRNESQHTNPRKPHWDPDRRELTLGENVVKKFKWPATNQERLLEAFQVENWPSKIDDPLPPEGDVCPRRRLHDTIKCLNKTTKEKIRFRGDGTGKGVILEIVGD